MLTVAEPALNIRAARAQLNEQDTLTLACLRLPPEFFFEMTGVANSPFGGGGSVVL